MGGAKKGRSPRGAALGLAAALLLAVAASASAEGIELRNDGRPTAGEGWGEAVALEDYQVVRVNVGEAPSMDTPAFVFDYGGDDLSVDFRNDDFKSDFGLGQGNIANPREVDDPEEALRLARRDLHYRYRLWVPGQEAPAAVIFTPYLIKATRADGQVVVKLTEEAIIERDIAYSY